MDKDNVLTGAEADRYYEGVRDGKALLQTELARLRAGIEAEASRLRRIARGSLLDATLTSPFLDGVADALLALATHDAD